MTSELAIKLRNAQFPYKDPSVIVPDWNENFFVVPTLSELIEACGKGFIYLAQNDDYSEWKSCGDGLEERTGKTPEEAVAKLWLALNTSTTAKAADELPE